MTQNVVIPSESAVTRTEEAAGSSAVEFLLDGLGVASLQELKLLVDVGRHVQGGAGVTEYRGVKAWVTLRDNNGAPHLVVAEFYVDPAPRGLDTNIYTHHAITAKGLSDDDSR